MKIEDLNEYQGLTIDKMRNYLERKGWTQFTMAYADRDDVTFWRHPTDHWSPSENHICEGSTLTEIAKLERRNVQNLLTEINPRTLSGKPSHSYAMSEWIKTSDRLPEPPSDKEEVQCIVFYRREVCILWFCRYHACWNDETNDDYKCEIAEVSHWMPIPADPVIP